MNKNNNNRYFQIGINGLLVVVGGLLFYYIIFYTDRLSSLISSIIKILTPFIAGFVLSFVLNPIMDFVENKILFRILKNFKRINLDNRKPKKIVRLISAFLTLIIFLGLVYSLIISVVPQIVINIQNIIERIPEYFLNIKDYYNNMLVEYPRVESILNHYWVDMADWFYETGIPAIENIISKSSTSILGSVLIVFKSLLNFVIGIIISLYLLIDKELFLAQAKKVIYAYLKEEKANVFLNNFRYTYKIFSGFLTGKVIDSIIIGIICYFCMLIFKFPYPALISVVVGVTNIIPYFGPFIGAIPSAFIVLLVNPKKCLFFLLFILVLQQFDGNIVGPKILGESTGLSSFWVIFAITIFGGIFGFVGMFIGVPTFAVIYACFRSIITNRLEKKNMPTSTSYYIREDYNSNEEDSSDYSGKDVRFNKKEDKTNIYDIVDLKQYDDDLQ